MRINGVREVVRVYLRSVWIYALFLMFLGVPMVVPVLLKKNQLYSETPVRPENLFEYSHIFAHVFSQDGVLDYQMSARQLTLMNNMDYHVSEPEVSIVNEMPLVSKSHQVLDNVSFKISSKEAKFSEEYLTFTGVVKLASHQKENQTQSSRGYVPMKVRSDYLQYNILKSSLVAQGKVNFCRGVQEVAADKVTGDLLQGDFVFDRGEIVYRRQSRC